MVLIVKKKKFHNVAFYNKMLPGNDCLITFMKKKSSSILALNDTALHADFKDHNCLILSVVDIFQRHIIKRIL